MIRYFIPADGDDAAHPNIFHLPPSVRNPPTLRDVRQSFPLPGAYHFRFKKRLDGRGGGGLCVWMDVTEDASEVPMCDGVVLAKVSRLSMDVAAATKPTAAGSTYAASSSVSSSSSSSSRPPVPQGYASAPGNAKPLSSSSSSSSSSNNIAAPPDSDPFGLFSESGGGGGGGGGVRRNVSAPTSTSSTPQRPVPGQGEAAKADLLDFDAFGSHPPQKPPAMRGTPPHPSPQGRPGYPPSSSSGSGWM